MEYVMLLPNGWLRNAASSATLTITCVLVFVCSRNNLCRAQEQARSVQYIETSGSIAKGPDYVSQVMILDGCVRRRSMKPRPTEGFPTDEPAPPGSQDFVEIHDAARGKRVYVYPDRREFLSVNGIRRSGPNKTWVEAVKADAELDFSEFLTRPIPLDNAKVLPERLVDGKSAFGFVIEDSSATGTSTATYWVDATTRLPVRIESRYDPADPKEDACKSVRRNIVFDAPLDRSLFSTDPPAGYTVLPDAEY
jgi:hypothetical protein